MKATIKTEAPCPARPRFAAGLLAVGLAGILAFCGALYLVHSRPAVFDPTAYSTEVPNEVGYGFDTAVVNGELVIKGWALELGRYVEKVEVYAVLYHEASGEYLRLPTAMVADEALGESFEDGPRNYLYGGFTARVEVKRLASPPGEYEICLAFRHNQLDVLVHTGEAAA